MKKVRITGIVKLATWTRSLVYRVSSHLIIMSYPTARLLTELEKTVK